MLTFLFLLEDELDSFLDKMDDPDAWRMLPGETEPISREELDILYRLQQGNTADITFDPYSASRASQHSQTKDLCSFSLLSAMLFFFPFRIRIL